MGEATTFDESDWRELTGHDKKALHTFSQVAINLEPLAKVAGVGQNHECADGDGPRHRRRVRSAWSHLQNHEEEMARGGMAPRPAHSLLSRKRLAP